MRWIINTFLGATVLIFAGFTFLHAFTLNAENDGIAHSAESICPLLVGAKIPDVKLTKVDGTVFDLSAAVMQKPALIVFYRGGWCPYCNMHLTELKNIENDLLQMGFQIIAISADRPEKMKDSIEKQNLHYTLLSDSEMVAAKAFGLAFRVSDEHVNMMKSHNINLEEASGKAHHILPVPAAFIVDTDGIIKFSYANPDYKVRVKAEVVLAAAKAALK